MRALPAGPTVIDCERALAIVLARYLRYSGTGLPVHTWPVAS